jgi:hypothetical protein
MANQLKKLIPRGTALRIIPLWTVILVAGSLLPGNAKRVIGSTRLSEQHQMKESARTGERKHRLFHLVPFGATSYLFLCAAETAGEEALAVLGVFGLGVLIELAQTSLYHGRFEAEDVRDNAYGIALVYVVVIGRRLIENARQDTRTALGGSETVHEDSPRSSPMSARPYINQRVSGRMFTASKERYAEEDRPPQ